MQTKVPTAAYTYVTFFTVLGGSVKRNKHVHIESSH
jgi:hypothetical protein